jgi:hypothetical protein
MTDIFLLRIVMRASKAVLDDATATLDRLQRELDAVIQNLGPQDPLAVALQKEVTAQNKVVIKAQANFNPKLAAYQAAVLADPMHSADPGLPLVLLPVRIETAYFPTPQGMDLVVRVYPDDIHVDTHEPELTQAELAAGTAYWRAVWGAGPNQARLDIAWTLILRQLKPARAAWSVRALLPAVPRPAEETPADQEQPEPPLATVHTRPGTFNRPARTTLLPDHWSIIGLRDDGIQIFHVEGAPIPDTLELSFGPGEPGDQGPDASDLPFQEGSRWLVDLDAAIANGMAVRIPLTEPDFKVSQLFVLGTSASVPPGEGAARLESALIAHQYTNGLAFLPPGTPTNNTSQTRSAWESAPTIPSPSDLDIARAGYRPGTHQNAAVVASAFGVDGSEVLSVAHHGLADQQSDIATIQRFLWPALGSRALSSIYTTWDVPQVGAADWKQHLDRPFAQALQAHAGGWVRSRGTLPVMRVGNQPYGLLPALSLDDWVTPAADPLTKLIPLLRSFRSNWAASLGTSTRVPPGADQNANSTVVNILQRQPVSVDIKVRAQLDPASRSITILDLPKAPIAGLPSNSQLSLSVPALTTTPLPVRVVQDGAVDRAALLSYQGMLRDGIAVIEQQPGHTKDTFLAQNKDLLGFNAFPGAPPADLFLSLIQDAFFDPLIPTEQTDAGLAFFIVVAALSFNLADPNVIKLVHDTLPSAKAFVERWDAVCGVSPDGYEAAIRETLDVFSHRLDAWITSLAARRLDEMRAARPSGLVLGAYGWVENLEPKGRVTDQHYIHAPSMNHAATAAVLRAGYDSHGNSGPLAVNLVSSRVRNADWLAAGVRSGQTVGALLGYRFERGLHEANLDGMIPGLRKTHPLPLPVGPNADVQGKVALEAIAERTVVDGLSLSKNRADVLAQVALADRATVSGLLDDLVDVIDSFGDLLLAESVHHLVGGNPHRAGLTADTAGRGEPVPDRFDVTLTPRSGRPLTWQLGALMPADFSSAATGWRTDRPRALAEPHAEAWAETMLGNAGSWLILCTLTTDAGPSPGTLTLDELQLCALDVVTESSGNPSQLELRIVEEASGGLPAGSSVSVVHTPNPDGTPGFGELLSLCARIRAALSKAAPLTPQHLQGADSSTVDGIDVSDLDARATALETSFSAAVESLQNAAQVLDADPVDDATVRSLRSALIGVADHGVPGAWPMSGSDTEASNVAGLRFQASSLLSAVRPLAGRIRPAAPTADAKGSVVTAWLGAVTEYVHGIVGTGIPLIPVYALPKSSQYAAAFAEGAAPQGADLAAIMVWMRRISRVRAGSAALHDVLLAAEVLQSASPGLTAVQLPVVRDTLWAGLPFPGGSPPKVRIGLVFSKPAAIDPAAPFCGFVCDTWTEQLPGVTAVASKDRGYEASEVTGLAFKVDTPAAAAPQAVLLAIAPDPAAGWSIDILFDTVKETLDLAKIRSVDLGDLVRLGRVLPAIRTSSSVDQMLSDAAKIAGGKQ